MKQKFWLLGLFVFQSAMAQQNPKAVSLAECIAQALGTNPSIQMSKAKVEGADARTLETNAALLPQLKLTGGAMELSSVPAYSLSVPQLGFSKVIFPDIKENYLLKLSLQQPLFTGFKLSKSKEMASLNAQAAKEDLTKEQSDMIVNVTVAYWNLYRAEETKKVIEQTLSQVNEHLKDAQSLARQGMATDADVMKVQVQLSDVRVKDVQARNGIRLAAMSLNSLIGNPLSTGIVLADTPQSMPNDTEQLLKADISALVARAALQRPEIKSMQMRCEMNEAGVTAAKGGWFPQIFLGADYNYARPNPRILPPIDEWDGTWDVGVTFQWTVWDWFTTEHQTAQAKATVRQSEAGLKQMRDAVDLDVAQQYYNAQTAAEEVDVTSAGAEQAKESYRMTHEKFKSGVASNSDLLDAEAALLQANLTQTQATVDYAVATAKLKRAIGDVQ
jgi:outer membrane protein TolC